MKKIFLTLLLFCSVQLAFSQNFTVSGVVTDSEGETLPGVTVRIESSGAGTITNIDGQYTLSGLSSNEKLSFSFVGMETQTLVVTSNKVINVTLVSSSLGLDEIQVVGYGVQKKVSVTGAIANIGHDELVKSPSASVTNSLAGKITGIAAIQNTGQPGADEASLYIRGMASLNDASPLTIVDGVERPFSQIDPEEIESIAVLKDASATAVYGVRGANGVIIVTTRRGEKGKARISVSTSAGLQQPTMMLDKSDSYNFAIAHNERNQNDGIPAEFNTFTPEAIEIFKNGGNLLYPDMDWYDYIFKKYALQTKSNFTLSGGTDRVRYFVALGVLTQDGQLKNFDDRYDGNFKYNRYNYRTNLDIDITKSTLMKVTLGGRTEIRNTPIDRRDGDMWKEANWAQPMSGAGIVDGKWIKTSQDNITLEFKDPLTAFYGSGYQNSTKNYLDMDIDLVQDLDVITKGLSARVKGSYNTNYTHVKKRGTSAASYEGIKIAVDPDGEANPDIVEMYNDTTGIVYRKLSDEGKMNYSESTGKARNWYMEAALNYNRKFGDHDFGGLLLYNQRVVHYAYAANLNREIPRRTLGLVGRFTYNYRTKYLFDINMGYNGSENFPEDKRYGFFPAVSLGWIITEESFMQDVNFMDYFKIRGSYGLVGNDRLGGSRFLYLPDSWTGSNGNYYFGTDNTIGQQGATELRIGNPDVTWETAVKQNYGFDAKFFDSKLSASFDYFKETRDDILITRQTVPGYVAANLPAVNMGKVENQGFEVEVRWRQKINQDFSYFASANVSYARNEVLFKDEVPKPHDYLYETGNPIGQPFGYVTQGFFIDTVNTATDPNYADQGVRFAGDLIYEDLNNDGKIDDLDQKPVGHSTRVPEYNFGMTVGADWKGFDFSMTFAGVKNTSRILPSYFREPFAGQNRGLFQYLYDDRWTPETANTALYPRFSKNSSANNYRDSDMWIVDASYLRLKNLELGYTLRSAALKRIGLSNVRVYVNGYNLLTFSDFKYFDPESTPGSSGLYPLTKMYNMGLKFNF